MSYHENFTIAQINALHRLKRGFEIRHPLTGNGVCFMHDPQKKVRSSRIMNGTLNALLDAKLLKLKSREYPMEIYVLK